MSPADAGPAQPAFRAMGLAASVRDRYSWEIGILAVAAGIRGWNLGQSCFWYDEVVTARLGQTSNPAELIALLGRIDATRAPLHPLVLQRWIAVFGGSETACRSLSVVCGVLTVAWVMRFARRAWDDPTTTRVAGLLAALSPALVIYARETRMYALLVLVTCVAWDALLPEHDGQAHPGRWGIYGMALVALGYLHPLGLIMAATLALATLVERRRLPAVRPIGWRRPLRDRSDAVRDPVLDGPRPARAVVEPRDGSGLSMGAWIMIHALTGLAWLPWLHRYFDHAPESTVGVQPLRFLLGVPIGFVGGNFVVLLGLVPLTAWAVVRVEGGAAGPRHLAIDRPVGTCLPLWLMVPPVVLYAYSRLAHPIFGPERYNLFVAPAYLLLLARGVGRLPRWPGWIVAAGLLALAALSLPGRAFSRDRADWRAAAAILNQANATEYEPVLVVSNADSPWPEIATAHYYLGDRPVHAERFAPQVTSWPPGRHVWYAVGLRQGQPVAPVPPSASPGLPVNLPGLRLIRVDGWLPPPSDTF